MAEEEKDPQPQWQGKASVELRGPKAEQVWPLLEDFCSIHKWLPGLDTCYKVEAGSDDLIRYCASTARSPSGGNETMETTSWAKERLVGIDPDQRRLVYEVLENNVGLKSYVATIGVTPAGDGGGRCGCRIEWSFVAVAEPVGEYWTADKLVSYVQDCLQYMAEKMEEALALPSD